MSKPTPRRAKNVTSGRVKPSSTVRRLALPPLVVAVVQPVAKRLGRMEALLIEMRHEQDVQLKRVSALQTQLETVAEYVKVDRAGRRRLA